MFVDGYYDRENDKIHVSERVNGRRKLLSASPDHVFYYEDGNGAYRTIFDDRCKKYRNNSIKNFRFELKKARDKKTRIFESDINPVFRHLADHYKGSDIPKLNVCFFDIEAGFDITQGGYAPPTDPFNEVTAISFYLTHEEKLFCFALLPPTLTEEEGRAISDQFENTFLFTDEKEMLQTFMDCIQDVDVLSGWNCIPLDEHVWLQNKISRLSKVLSGNITSFHGKVVGTHRSGMKVANEIKLANGFSITASDEHIIPVMIKGREQYKYASSLKKTTVEKNVSEIKKLLEDNDVYMSVALRNNINVDYTYGEMLSEFGEIIPATVTKSENSYTLKFNKSSLLIDGNESISDDFCRLLGMIYTDGSIDKNNFRVYGSNFVSMSHYNDILDGIKGKKTELKPLPRNKEKLNGKGVVVKQNKDMFRISIGGQNKFGIIASVACFENRKKKLNLEFLSRLSYRQFCAFYSGMLDGDGCISNNMIQLCNYNSSIKDLQELLFWNGVVATASENVIVISPSNINKRFIGNLSLSHNDRSRKIDELKWYEITNAPNKKLKQFVSDTEIIIKVKSIEAKGLVEMGDIETERHFFNVGGVVVHNSEQYDIPYTINRVKKILSKEATKKFCLWDVLPKEREYKSKFGSMIKTYDLVGRVHLDYMQLYQKHNTKQQLSYRLDYIGEDEVGANKVPYEGNLDDLYKKDFYKFIDYSRQDVNILVLIDKKLKFIELANQVAHQNYVTLKTTMGSVVLVEQAIINYMHKTNLVVPDKKLKPKFDDLDGLFEIEDEKKPVVGAYVADPKTGLHHHIGCVDINSLYPSAIRALNMSPETIVGQVRPTETMALIDQRIAAGTKPAEAWEGIFMLLELEHMHAEDEEEIVIDFEDGTVRTMTGAQLYAYIFDQENHVCITANGTIFRTDRQGIIPALLAEWYAERKKQQAKQVEYIDLASKETDPDKKKEYEGLAAFYDQRQYAIKILLNSLYGALLNEFLRFYDGRLGQSTTLTGRCIVRHMNGQINKIITGTEDYKGEAIIYADTDSCYFSAYEYLKDKDGWEGYDWTKENIIEMYDAIADGANETFSSFMQKTFNTSSERGGIIKAGRELVASSGLFIKKKKYAVLMYDKENKRLDIGGKPGKLKVMGLDLKRADTPKFMQKFLESLLMDILTEKEMEKMHEDIKQFRILFKDRPSWEKGSPKKVADLTKYLNKVKKSDSIGVFGTLKEGDKLKVTMPGHVRASMNWNKLCDMHDDHYSTRIVDGTRIIVCKLRSNTMKMDSVAFPMDQQHLPEWFKELPFDDGEMEEVIINKKLMNLVGVLSWDLSGTVDRMDDDLFSFGEEKKMIGHNGGPEISSWHGGDDGDFDEDE